MANSAPQSSLFSGLHPFRGLARRLLISHLLLASVPLVVLSVFIVLLSRSALADRTFDQLRSVAELKRVTMERFLSQKSTELARISTDRDFTTQVILLRANPDSTSNQNALLERLLETVAADPDYRELFLIDADTGRLLLSSTDRERDTPYTSEPIWIEGRKGPYSGPFQLDPQAGTPLVAMSVPISDAQNNVVAVLAAPVNIVQVQQIIEDRTGLGEHGQTYMVDRLGKVMFAPNITTANLPTEQLTSTAIAAVLRHESGQGSYTSPLGVPVVGIYTYLPGQDAGLVAEQEAGEALRLIDQLQWLILVVAALAVLLVGTVALFVARKIATPVLEMATGARAVAAGDLDVQLPTEAPDEVGVLATAFRDMTATLRERTMALEIRQTELEQANVDLVASSHELAQSINTQQTLADTIRQLTIPILPVLKGVLVMPLIGTLDPERAIQTQITMLHAIEEYRAHTVLMDVTGVPMLDQETATLLINAWAAARLLGARVMLVGIRPEVAQSLVGLGIDLAGIETAADLRSGVARL